MKQMVFHAENKTIFDGPHNPIKRLIKTRTDNREEVFWVKKKPGTVFSVTLVLRALMRMPALHTHEL